MDSTHSEHQDEPQRVLIVVGTVREGRWSIHPARELVDRFDDRVKTVELFDMNQHEVPLMESMRRSDDPTPDAIETFGESVNAADLLVIVTPEYNHSIPGALKNLLDYLYEEYDGLPFAYVTVSAGQFGGVRALSHLTDITLELGGRPGPDLPIAYVQELFDDEGSLLDADYDDRFAAFVEQSLEHAVEQYPDKHRAT